MADAGLEPEHNEDPEPEQGAGLEPDHDKDEARRKFREALDRKRARNADSDGGRGGAGAGQVQQTRGPALSRRSFRRKSG
jgi:hypothetical protein